MDPTAAAQLWDAQLRTQAAAFPLSTRHASPGARRRSAYLLDELFFDLLALSRPRLFIEAGAFDATTSLAAAELLGPDATVIAFEANPANHEHFSRTLDHPAGGVDYRHAALSDAAGPVVIRQESLSDGDSVVPFSSTLPRDPDAPWLPGSDVVEAEVPGVRLDDEVPAHSRCALWIDVEGASGPVLGGASDTLRRCDLLKIEVEDDAYWVGQLLAVDVLSVLLDHGLVPIARDVENPNQYNVLCVSADLLRQPGAQSRLDRFLRESRHREPSPVIAKARAHPAYASASRSVRSVVARLGGR